LGLPPGAPLALFFGHRRPYKGLPILLAAWHEVVGRVPQARLMVVGPGRPLASGHGSIIDRPGFVAEEDVPVYLAAADAVVLPYLDTDDSAVAAAALAAGRPVVASAVGGLPEVVGEGGLLVPPGDPQALAGALAGLMASPERTHALAMAAARRGRAWTWADAARRHGEVYAAVGGRA
jgi:glycosyltransferase involved in cell wall biosynthesis